MKKKIALLTALGIFTAGTACASGYRIPEQSINSVALSNAYIAHTEGPDTAYYNPANMGWQEDRWQLEASVSYINLPHIDYTAANNNSALDGSSKTENLFIPMFHLVSPEKNNFRFGFSFVVPYGLSKRWDDAFQKRSAEEFTLNVFEANPSISYTFCDRFSVAAGARILHTTNNTVKNDGTLNGIDLRSDMDGDSTDLGYNLAMTVKPTPEWAIAATYRSRVVQSLSGDAVLYTNIPSPPYPYATSDTYRGGVTLDVVTPAVLTLSTSYTFDKTTVELTWDKTYWSKYDHLDFNFDNTLSVDPLANGVLTSAFNDPKNKDWSNSNAYRIGVTHKCTDQLTAMAGFAYDENPVPNSNLGFELPDSDALLYSFGVKYQLNADMEVGGAYLYDYKKTRKIDAQDANINGINGEFENGGAHVLTMGLIYKF
ncbi:MAG: outer membrane protein transport protein [Pseudomonadota bacterium]